MICTTPLPKTWRDSTRLACNEMDDAIKALWRRDGHLLDDASLELGTCLELFQGELDRHRLFSFMPVLRDDFDYVWMMFLDGSAPGNFDEYSALHGLDLSEFCLAFAKSRVAVSRGMCGWDNEEAREIALRAMQAADRAVSVAERIRRGNQNVQDR